MVWVPSLRCGQAAVLARSGVELKLAMLRQSLALIRFCLRSSAQPEGWVAGAGSGMDSGLRRNDSRGPSFMHAGAAHTAK